MPLIDRINKRLTDARNYIGKRLFEYYVQTLIILGLPFIAYIYIDWKAAASVFIVVNIVLGVLALRGNK